MLTLSHLVPIQQQQQQQFLYANLTGIVVN